MAVDGCLRTNGTRAGSRKRDGIANQARIVRALPMHTGLSHERLDIYGIQGRTDIPDWLACVARPEPGRLSCRCRPNGMCARLVLSNCCIGVLAGRTPARVPGAPNPHRRTPRHPRSLVAFRPADGDGATATATQSGPKRNIERTRCVWYPVRRCGDDDVPRASPGPMRSCKSSRCYFGTRSARGGCGI